TGSAVDNSLQIAFDGTNYIFADPSEQIDTTGGLVGLDTNPDPNIVVFDPSALTINQINVNVGDGSDDVSVSSIRSGDPILIDGGADTNSFNLQVGGQPFQFLPQLPGGFLGSNAGTLVDPLGNIHQVNNVQQLLIDGQPIFPQIDMLRDTVAFVELQDASGQFLPEPILIPFVGPTTVVTIYEGVNFGDARDDGGAITGPPNSLEEVQSQITLMDLFGIHPQLGPMQLHLDPLQPSFGEVQEIVNDVLGQLDVPPFGPGVADVAFDVFAQIEVQLPGQPLLPLQPVAPFFMNGVFGALPPLPGDELTNLGQGPVQLLLPPAAPPTAPDQLQITHVTHIPVLPDVDFGDAPTAAQSGLAEDYPTELANFGAFHIAVGPTLGSLRDAEPDGQPTPPADGDDASTGDEDGISFTTTPIAAATDTTASVEVDLQNPDGTQNLLDGWIDFNRDGDWDDAGEQIFAGYDLGTTAGVQTLGFTVPGGTTAGETYSRFRLNTVGPLASGGPALNGEVEDHVVTIVGDTGSGLDPVINVDSNGGNLRLESDGTDVVVQRAMQEILRLPQASVNQLTVEGSGADDNVIVDLAGGGPGVPIFVNGNGNGVGTPGDMLTVEDTDGGSFTTTNYLFVNANDGAVDYDGATITYTGLEPVIDNTDAVDRVFTFTGGGETITLSDDGVASDGFSSIDSTLGEIVTFLNPTGSLTINAGTGVDVIELMGVDDLTTIPNLIVNGDGDDDVINGSAIAAGTFTTVTLNGNAGLDLITGTAGDDLINGGDDNDTIIGFVGADVQNGDAGDDLFIWNDGDGPDDNTGGADNDTFRFNGADGPSDELQLVSGPGDGSLAGAEFNLERFAPSAFTIEGAAIENVEINTFDGDDDVTVAPSATLDVTVDGGTEASSDVLRIDAGGAGVIVTDTSVTIAGSNPILYSDTEDLDITNAGTVEILGDAGSNLFEVAGGAAADEVVMTIDGQLVSLQTTGLTFRGLGGDDVLVFIEDAVNGLPAFSGVAIDSHSNAAFSASGLGPADIGLHFDGGGDSDSVVGIFATAQDVAYFSDDVGDSKSGVINVSGALTMSFVGLEPIGLVGAGGSLTVDATSTPATTMLTVMDLAPLGDGVNEITGDGGFETTTFSGFASVTVRGGDGSETITLASLDDADPDGGGPGAALTAITLDGDNTAGTDAAEDLILVEALSASVTATVMGGLGNDIISVGSPASSLDPILGTVNVIGEDHNALPETMGIVSAKGNDVTFNGPSGDVLIVDDAGDGDASTWDINDGSVMRSGAGAVTHSAIETLFINTGSGADDINVLDTTDSIVTDIGDFGGSDDIDVTTTGDGGFLIINAGTGDDVIDIAATGAGSLTIADGESGMEVITMESSGAGAGVGLFGGINGDTIVVNGTGSGGAVTEIQAGDDPDVININATAAGSFTDAFGGLGEDAIDIDGSDPNTLDGVLGDVDVLGGGGIDVLTVNDEDDTSENTYIVNANDVARQEVGGGSPDVVIGYDEVETLTLLAGEGDDKVIFRGSDAAEVVLNGNLPTGVAGDPDGDQLILDALLTAGPLRNATTGAFIAAAAVPAPPGPTNGTFTDFEQVIWQDRYEINDIFDPVAGVDQSYVLGSEREIVEADLSIHSDTDVDFFRYTAHSTGMSIFNTIFNHDLGDLQMNVRDRAGNVIASANTATDNEQIAIPVVGQEVYYVEIRAVADADPAICNANNYSLEIENFAAPKPELPDLVIASDSGMMSDDEVTNAVAPTIVVVADLVDFAAMGIPVDAGSGTPGAEVLIGFTNNAGALTSVQAALLPGSNNHWTATLGGLADDSYQVSAWVVVRDGGTPAEIGRGAFSEPLQVVLDTAAPTDPAAPDLLSVADSGTSSTDNVTNKMQPAFAGTTEPGVKVRLMADGEQVGSTVANTDGSWEITSQPLVDGIHDITVVVEDLAGNINDAQTNTLSIEIDTLAPNTPYLDLITDTGHSDTDNITNAMPAVFTMTTLDPDQVLHDSAFNYEFRIYDRAEGVAEILIYDSAVDGTIPPANLADNLTDLEFLQREYALSSGVHNLKLEVEDRAGNISADFLLTVEIDKATAVLAPDLLESSDTGMYNDDNVTNKMSPALSGLAEAGSEVRLFARNAVTGTRQPVGSGIVGSSLSDNDASNFGASLSGSQEVPSVVSAATGVVTANLNAAGTALTISIQTTGLDLDTLQTASVDDDVTGVHIHAGQAGANGPVVFGLAGLVSDLDDLVVDAANGTITGIWDNAEGNATTLADQLANLRAGNLYVNIHTNANLSGEVRGQLLPLGLWEITSEPLADGVYDLSVEVEDWAGNREVSSDLRVEIDTIAPNTPLLDLDESSDSGRHNDDNVTNDSTPSISLTTHDANANLHVLVPDLTTVDPSDVLFDYLKYRVYDRAETGATGNQTLGAETLVYDSSTDATADGSALALGHNATFTNLLRLNSANAQTTLAALDDGTHSLKLEVEDRAGNISQDFLIDIVIDTVAPPVTILDRIDGDSGDPFIPALLNDRVTNDIQPTFRGTAEADAIVNVFVDGILNGAIDVPGDSALTIAVPADGDDAFALGQWSTEFTYDLNDDRFFVRDGVREILVTATDLAGNTNAVDDAVGDASQVLDAFIDTQGPLVTEVFITDDPMFDLFTTKVNGVVQGPTPAVHGLSIGIRDLPDRTAGFLYAALSNTVPVGLISLIGDHSGIIPILDVAFNGDAVVAGSSATGNITITFADPLPDDRFTLTLADGLIDPVGNALDGESNATEPVGTPVFPTGDGIPGQDFLARFTVDSRPEIATQSQGIVYADINGNFAWDPEGRDNDATNRDFVYNFGNITDAYFAGDFSGVGATSSTGFDKVGSYGAFNTVYQFFLDTNDDGVQDFVSNMPPAFQVNGTPVAGNFDDTHPGDEIGLFDGQNWYLDVDGSNAIEADEQFPTVLRGIPIVGDFNGDGVDDLGTYNNSTGRFHFDLDGDHATVDDTIDFGFSGLGEIPVVGDMNLDGVDDLVMWVPGRDGQLPEHAGEFHMLVSDNVPLVPDVNTLPSTVFNPFSPSPLGNDLFVQIGDDAALPLIGNFDPPIEEFVNPIVGSLQNLTNQFDVNIDGMVSPSDILAVINTLIDQSNGVIESLEQPIRVVAALGNRQADVNGDKQFTPIDILLVINELVRLNDISNQQPESLAGESSTQSWALRVDSALMDDDEDEDLLRILSEPSGTF
ncbi:MAG: CHRD domain-containing protein, partial [Pirellulaceae bacterium]|nr:CHRD domain-containing protein [Pirellulaceae bacterium]